MSKGNKVYPVISVCPVCKHDLRVAKLKCDHCDTVIEGDFTLSKFNYLETDKLYFIEVFIKNRGNIKAIEKELNISYPTVKKMLDEVITVLGYSPDQYGDDDFESEQTKKAKNKDWKTSVLDRIEKGELKVNEAIDLIKKRKSGE